MTIAMQQFTDARCHTCKKPIVVRLTVHKKPKAACSDCQKAPSRCICLSGPRESNIHPKRGWQKGGK